MPTRGDWQHRFGACIRADRCVFDPGCELHDQCQKTKAARCAFCHTPIRPGPALLRRTPAARWRHTTAAAALYCRVRGRPGKITREANP